MSPTPPTPLLEVDSLLSAELEAIYRFAPLGLAVFDRQLRFVRVNDRFAEVNCIPAAEHLGRTVRQVVPDLANAAEEQARRVLETEQPVVDFKFSRVTASQPGVLRHWVEQWLPMKNRVGEVVGILTLVEEVTERRRAEEILRESRITLEKSHVEGVLRTRE